MRLPAEHGNVLHVHFVIMGSGRVGASLAQTLDSRGHSVAIIDRDPDAFRRLPSDFSGQRVTGMGFDRDVLRQAGIEDAYAFAAVASGDNSNILAARIVRETYGVTNVVARIYDPHRADVYQRLGIPTVGTVSRTVQSILTRLLPVDPEVLFQDETGKISLLRCLPAQVWIGKKVALMQEQLKIRVGYISRFGNVFIPDDSTNIQEGDEIFAFCSEEHRKEIVKALSTGPKEEDE